MSNYSKLMLLTLAVLAGSCKMELPTEPTQMEVSGLKTLRVGIDETKTAISAPDAGKRKVIWSAGDQISLNGTASVALTAGEAGESKAEFTWDPAISPAPATYSVLYPASFYKNETTITLPHSQNKMPGDDDLATDTLPMCGYSNAGAGMNLTHICSIIKVQIQLPHEGTMPKIAYVEFRGNSDEQVSGDFTIDYTTGDLTSTSAKDLDKAVRAFSIKSGNEDDVLVCNVVVPSGTYSGGFSLRIVDSNGGYMDKQTVSSVTLALGSVIKLPSFVYGATGFLDARCISTAEELIEFAKDWNSGKFENCHGDAYLTSDIDFDETTSAAFVATGGIGSATNPINGDSNHYNGIFSGNGFSINNLSSSVPLFAFTGGACVINELNLAASCTFTCAADGSADFGTFGGRFKGEMIDCHCYADINVEGNSLSADRYIGGLAGRFYDGDANDCSMDGDIILASSGSYTAQCLYIGGIGGSIQGSSKSVITRCEMNGKIQLVGSEEFDGPAFASFVYAGGIVGDATRGTVQNCTTDSDAEVTLHGSFKPGIGGIAGIVKANGTIKDCTNAASLEFKSNAERANTTPTYIGGIAGGNGVSSTTGGTIQGCTNNGAISSKCNSTTLALAGIAAFNNGSMSDCVNNGNILRKAQLTNDQTNRYISMGGAVGTFKAGSVTHVENNGNVTFQEPGAATQTTVAMGGIVARINEGSEAVTISNCSNSGTIYENGGSNVTATAWKATAGIVGYVGQPATISQCSNTGTVQFEYNTEITDDPRSSYVGGIVGVCGVYDSSWGSIAGVSILNCTNYGQVQNQNFNDTYTAAGGAACGGIAGMLYGDSKNKIAVTGCDNISMVGFTGTIISKRGYQGGIVGYASNATISNCTNTKNTSSNIPRFCGGIVGQMDASSVSGCTVQDNNLIGSSSSACDMGGVAGTMDATSSIESCDVINVKLTIDKGDTFKWGAIAATTASGASITDCRLSGGYSVNNGSTYTPFATLDDDICSDGNATMSGNSLYDSSYDVTGTVSCGGSPLAGVVVSDGYSCVQTGSDGKYYLKKNSNATCVSVSFPSGYEPNIINGCPYNYQKLSKVTPVDGIRTVDFALNEVADPDQFTIIAYADIQMRTSGTWGDNIGMRSGAVANDVFTDIKNCAQGKSGKIIGLSMGDEVNNAPEMYDIYVDDKNMGSLSFANYCIPGNHDYDISKYDYISALDAYEACLSPSRYSFNYGKFHFVMVDNARTVGDGKGGSSTETKGLPDPAWEWLQNDLKYVPKSTPIILCAHRPLFTESYTDTGAGTYRKRDISTHEWCLNPGYASLLASYKHVYAFNGDTHAMFNDVYTSGDKTNIEVHGLPRATGALWINQFINVCGTPRGYLVMSVNGTDVTYKYKPVSIESASPFNSPIPMTYRDYNPQDMVFYMKRNYLSNPSAELDDFYQIHAYVPGAYTENEGAYVDDVLATVFMYDPRWSDVTFEYAGGTMKMAQIPISAGVHDPGFTWLHKWYSENISDNTFKEEFTNDYANYNIFRCTPPDGVRAGVVRVTDHFGNDYEYRLSW